MNNEALTLAQLSLSHVFNIEYHKKFVRDALKHYKSTHADLRRDLERVLNRCLRIDGFKHALKAPIQKLTSATVEHLFCPGVLNSLLAVWLDSKEDLRHLIKTELNNAELTFQEIYDLRHNEIVGWAGKMTAIVNQIREKAPALDEDDLALMICCVVAVPEIEALEQEGGNLVTGESEFQEAVEHGVDSPQIEEKEGQDDVVIQSVLFRDSLSFLSALPIEAVEWLEVEAFVGAVRKLAQKKLEDQETASNERRLLLETFDYENQDELSFFGIQDFGELVREIDSTISVPTLTAKLDELRSLFAQHNDLGREQGGGLQAVRKRRDLLVTLEDRILILFDDLRLFVAPNVSVDANTAQLTTRDDLLPEISATNEPENVPATNDRRTTAELIMEGKATADTPTAFGQSVVSQVTLPEYKGSTTALDAPDDAIPLPSTGEVSTKLFELANESVSHDVNVQEKLKEPIKEPESAPGTSFPDQPSTTTRMIGNDQDIEEPKSQRIYSFATDQSATEIATLILQNKVDMPTASQDLVWRLMFEGRFGLAFHLQSTIDVDDSNREPSLPAWFISAVALSPHLRYDNGDIARMLSEPFTKIDEGYLLEKDVDEGLAILLMCGAAAIRPALLAPATRAPSSLRHIPMASGLRNLYRYWQSIADYGNGRQALEPNSLKKVKDTATWQLELDALIKNTKEWSRRAPRLHMTFPRARRVWHSWQESGQLIDRLLQPVLHNDDTKLVEAKALVERWSDDAEIRREIVLTDRRLLKRQPEEDITAKALVYLRNHVRAAVNFVRQWIDFQDSRPGRAKGFSQQQAERLSQEIALRKAAVQEELKTLSEEHSSFFMLTSTKILRAALEDLWMLLDSVKPISPFEPEPKYILHAELLKAAGLELNEAWEPVNIPKDLSTAILKLIARGQVNWRTAIEEKSKDFDHQATGRIIEYLETQGNSTMVAELRQLRKTRVDQCRELLEREVKLTKEEVKHALVSGRLREREHVEEVSEISVLEGQIGNSRKSRQTLLNLRQLRAKLNAKKRIEIDSIKRRLKNENIGSGHPVYTKIVAALERGDTSTANEYFDPRFRNVDHTPNHQTTDVFREFFPLVCADIDNFLRSISTPPNVAETHIQEIVSTIRSYAKGETKVCVIGPVNLDRVQGEQAERAAEMVRAWFKAKKERTIDSVGAKGILNNLGFQSSDRTVYHLNDRMWVAVTALPIRDREHCPIPTFGSSAEGHYRILCMWGKPSPKDLIDAVGETSQTKPILVLYFGRLSEESRRELAFRNRDRRRTFVVVDDTLMLYLCGEPEPRLHTMFRCSLPFTFAEPYTTTPGLVAIEMFYGRDRERHSIFDPMDSCFVYGGRQLGKTVLLRDVERRFNDHEDHIVFWFDIQANGFGRGKRFPELWGALAGELQKLGLPMGVAPRQTKQITLDKFLEAIIRWLDENRDRRLLLLLDEADDFLVFDGTKPRDDAVHTGGFPWSAQLKGAMDRTERRFKVVFAGLHNVQRTTRLSNHPLAHYGEPICIGPLLDHGEWREARNLIQQPLAAMGYYFAEQELIDQILWQTNYYPSLIQLYCKYLLRQVTSESLSSHDRVSPPYLIKAHHLKDAYLNEDLRKAIREKLEATLQLDQRYEVIAYAMALETIGDKERSMLEGFSISWIRQQAALTWWPEGFRQSDSKDSIQALLDEMVGLGILREVETGRYALRSTNVLSLMGTEEDIDAALTRSREVPPEYEPATFRAPLYLGGTAEAALFRSPLTDQQESDLLARHNRVSIIFGCQAAGLDDLETRLRTIFGPDYFVNVDGTPDRAGFAKKLSDLVVRERQGTTLVYVPLTCPWSGRWVVEAHKKVKRFNSTVSSVRIVFIADPQAAWQLVTDQTDSLFELTDVGVTTIELGPLQDSALRQWLDDLQHVSDPKTRERIWQVTGNWPVLLNRLFEISRSEGMAMQASLSRLAEELKIPDMVRPLLGFWGLDNLDAIRVFDYLVTGDVTIEDLAQTSDSLSTEEISQRLTWGDHLGIVSALSLERWRIDPTVGHVMGVLNSR